MMFVGIAKICLGKNEEAVTRALSLTAFRTARCQLIA
jgi:hypothetical protein